MAPIRHSNTSLANWPKDKIRKNGFSSSTGFLSILTGVCLFLANLAPAHADLVSAAALKTAEENYEQAKQNWREDKAALEAFLKKQENLENDYQQAQSEYWETRKAFERSRAKELRNLRSARNTFEKTYRAKVRQYDELKDQFDESLNDFVRINEKFDRGNGNAIDKIRRRRIQRKTDKLDQQLKIIALERDELAASFDESNDRFEEKLETMWRNRPKRSSLSKIDEWYKIKSVELKRPVTADGVDNRREQTQSTAEKLLLELLKNSPTTVTRVEVHTPKGLWYTAQMQDAPHATGESSTGATAVAYKKAIGTIDKELAEIDREITKAESILPQIRTEWEAHHKEYAAATETIANTEYYTSISLAVIEVTAVGATAYISAGTAAPAAYATVSSISAYIAGESISKANKLIPMLTKLLQKGTQSAVARRALSFARKNISPRVAALLSAAQKTKVATDRVIGQSARKTIKKTANLFESEGAKGAGEIIDTYSSKWVNDRINKDNGIPHVSQEFLNNLSSPTKIALGDFVENVIADGGAGLKTVLTRGAAVSATDLAVAQKMLAVAAVATASKVTIRALADLKQNSLIWPAALASAGASNARIAYLSTVAVRNMLLIERAHFIEAKNTYKALLDHGPRSKQKNVTTDNQLTTKYFNLAKNGNIAILVHFSSPLDFPPLIASPGITFSKMTVEASDKKVWRADITDSELDKSAHQIKLYINVSAKEQPYGSVDAKPQSAARLEGLARDRWNGFEKEFDQNHVIRLKSKHQRFTCSISSKLSQSVASGESPTLTLGIIKPDKPSNCTYWAAPGYGILGVNNSGNNIQADWVKVFPNVNDENNFAINVAVPFSMGVGYHLNSENAKFAKGPFFTASKVYSARKLMGSVGKEVATHVGSANATVDFACVFQNERGSGIIQRPFSSEVRVAFYEPTSHWPGRMNITLDYNAVKSLYEREVVGYESTGGDFVLPLYGIKECKRSKETDSVVNLHQPTINSFIGAFQIPADVDAENMTASDVTNLLQKLSSTGFDGLTNGLITTKQP